MQGFGGGFDFGNDFHCRFAIPLAGSYSPTALLLTSNWLAVARYLTARAKLPAIRKSTTITDQACGHLPADENESLDKNPRSKAMKMIISTLMSAVASAAACQKSPSRR